MAQIALPLTTAGVRPTRIVVGGCNESALSACRQPQAWPFRTAVLFGPPRSGKSLIARWFAESGLGESIDEANHMDETALFHRWNRVQEDGRPLLLVCNGEEGSWKIALPDLASRLGAAMHLTIEAPDDAFMAELISVHAEQRGLALGEGAAGYLVPRVERSHMAAERLVAAIDRLSLERKQPATLAIWRDALEELSGEIQPRLL